MTFPIIETAATDLGAHQSATVRQFWQPEHDAGAKLHHDHRSTARQHVRPEIRDFVRTPGSR